jgi:hypothetical protein
MKLTALLAAVMLAAVMALAACGDDDDDENGGGGGGDETAEAATLEIESTEAGGGERSRISAPESVEAGLVEVSFTNAGKKDHEAQILRLEGGHTAEEALRVLTGDQQRIPPWVTDGGGVGTTKPGETRTATQVLEPGNYMVIDFDQNGIAPFEVTGEATDAELPETDATVTASEYTFETSGLRPGANTILFENTGAELHHIIANPVKPDATPKQVARFFQSGEKTKNPFQEGAEEAGVETAVIDGGVSQVVDLELEAGEYAFQCFIPDRAGGPPHAFKGMITIEEVQ